MADLSSDAGQLADLLRATVAAHHHAFIDVDGADPEWPIWYAAYLHARLPELQGVALTQSEWVFLLVLAEQRRLREGSNEHWPDYYAGVFLEEIRQGNPLSAK
ncbi:MAG: hypothetical protein KDI03_18505 [Anaerolineae bacterium]|nr:hypothetical protein [Anaerolineae bacterium]MCB0204722.1 hypothetical protein [Anaerolineae bacterium]